ncbi:hypothetical protein GCM10020256_60320 [Streptomyces thermocoprophilus]
MEATAQEVDATVTAAHAARDALADRTVRAAFLRTAADRLEARRDQLVEVADAETALGPVRLTGELARTCYQLRAFAGIVDEGAFLDVVIDHPDDTATPPVPDLRRHKVPLGVVAVYSASNFPFAFSVPGGDTASALAAGCPVVVKAHPDHPALSELVAKVLRDAAAEHGVPAGVLGLVHGFDAGLELIRHPLVAAAGFTGSVRGGRALFDEAAARPVPIPFHGELGSLNPVVVTEAAAAERAEAIGTGLAGSMTLGVGQFCVKPGLVLVPSGAAGDGLVKSLTDAVSNTDPGVLLDHRMRDNFVRGVAERGPAARGGLPGDAGRGRRAHRQRRVPHRPGQPARRRRRARPAAGGVLRPGDRRRPLRGRRRGRGRALPAARQPHRDRPAVRGRGSGRGKGARLLAELTPLAGRVVVNGWPTGVAVAPAQHHGGPYPATTSTSTSVGGHRHRALAAPRRLPERPRGPAPAGAARRQPARPSPPCRRPPGTLTAPRFPGARRGDARNRERGRGTDPREPTVPLRPRE